MPFSLNIKESFTAAENAQVDANQYGLLLGGGRQHRATNEVLDLTYICTCPEAQRRKDRRFFVRLGL